MRTCPNCHSPHEEGQKFCKECGAVLFGGGPGQAVCPRCGAELAGQAFCHNCGLPVQPPATPAAGPPPQASPAYPPGGPRTVGRPREGFAAKVSKGSPTAILALVGGCVALLVLILVGVNWLARGPAPAPVQMAPQAAAPQPGPVVTPKPQPAPAAPGGMTAAVPATPPPATAPGKPGGAPPAAPPAPSPATPGPPPAAAPQASNPPEELGPPFFTKTVKLAELAKATPPPPPAVPAPSLTLEEEIEELLFSLRQAYLEKNIKLYMDCLAGSFPNREEKRLKTTEMLMANTFPHLVFNIDAVPEKNPDNPTALITWHVQVKPVDKNTAKKVSTRYKVQMVRENGKLLINGMEKVED